MNTEQVPNPLNFHCASNQATPDYIIYDDFRSFVAYGLWVCWLGDDNDPNADCYFARPITKQDVKELRGYFLDILESVLMALLQKKVEPGYGEVDGDWPSLHIYQEPVEDEDQFDSLTWQINTKVEIAVPDLQDKHSHYESHPSHMRKI